MLKQLGLMQSASKACLDARGPGSAVERLLAMDCDLLCCTRIVLRKSLWWPETICLCNVGSAEEGHGCILKDCHVLSRGSSLMLADDGQCHFLHIVMTEKELSACRRNC